MDNIITSNSIHPVYSFPETIRAHADSFFLRFSIFLKITKSFLFLRLIALKAPITLATSISL